MLEIYVCGLTSLSVVIDLSAFLTTADSGSQAARAEGQDGRVCNAACE